MTDERQSGPLFESWLKGTDPMPPDARPTVARVMARVPQTRQRGRWWPLPAFDRPAPIPATNERTRPRGFTMFSALKFIAAGVIVALFGGFLFAGVLTTQQSDEVLPAAVSASPTVTAASDVLSTDESAQLVAGPGPWLAWERAPELDESMAERYERRSSEPFDAPFAEGTPGAWTFEHGDYVLAVRDGDATRSDPHGLLDGYDPLRLWVIRPDGSTEEHMIDRAYRVRNVAIGPAGILVRTSRAVSGGGVEQLALAGRFRKGERAPQCCDLQPDGTVTTDGSGGLPRVIKFGQYRDRLQRIGLRRADLAGPHYWLWRDGAGWSETEAPPESEPVVATQDGYYMLGKDGRLHFSVDLLDWDVIDERLRQPGGWPPPLGYLGDRVLYVSDDEIAWIGPGGLEPTPFGQAVDEAGPIRSLAGQLLPWPGSEDGLVLIDDHTDSALFTPGGQSWGLAPLAVPAGRGTEFEIRDGQLIQASPSGTDGMWLAYRAVATDERPG